MMKKGDLCHYYDSSEDHSVDVRPCKNCGVPVCASEECRIDGFCIECAEIKDDEDALMDRAEEMEEYYRRAHARGI